MELVEVLKSAIQEGASDVILSVGSPVAFRIDGDLRPTRGEPLSAEATQKLVYALLNDGQVARFERDKELDFSLTLHGRHRFRGNVFYQKGTVAAAKVKSR